MLIIFFIFFSVRLLLVLHGHFIHYIFFPILFMRHRQIILHMWNSDAWNSCYFLI